MVASAVATLAQLYDMTADEYEVNIQFGDGVLEDAQQEFDRRWGMVLAGKLKLEVFYAWYFGVSEEEAKAMIPQDNGFPAEE